MNLTTDDTKKIFRPQNIDQLDDIINRTREKLTYVAGATDLMLQDEQWNSAEFLLDLTSVRELNTIDFMQDKGILIGSALPVSQIITNSLVQKNFQILIEACRQIGSVQIQNRATLGGNIANASPAGDSLPALNVLDSELWIGPRKNGKFTKSKVSQVMTGAGQNNLKLNSYIATIFIPFQKLEDQFWYFRKLGQRHTLAISKLSLAVLGWKKDQRIEEIRICAGSVSPLVKRAFRTEALLNHQILTENLIESARDALIKEIQPITDIRSTDTYRRLICGEILREMLYDLMK